MTPARPATPLHLWITGTLASLWNLIGAFDYTMTQTRNATYLAQFSEQQIAYFESFPWFMELAWALGVWGAIGGSLLLLARSRHAVAAFIISLAGLAGSTVWQLFLSGADIDSLWPMEARIVTGLIWIIAIALLVYARRMRAQGVLR